ncbi:Histone-fold [Cynara cardunculus var. scolymus]|uniref:Histone-fold n=1 Tax=Cynara cardunculus var. scolymus TaxID=59895 RepID=A0A103XMR1_CYNCS|nr:Histone-fold [Cynara cardunculus var. scolymus]
MNSVKPNQSFIARILEIWKSSINSRDSQDSQILPWKRVLHASQKLKAKSVEYSLRDQETIQECASEFLSFVTGEASDKCHKENRKTVNGDDICWALASLGFDDSSEAIVRYLSKYREFERERAAASSSATSVAPANQIKEENVDKAAAGSSNSCERRYHF